MFVRNKFIIKLFLTLNHRFWPKYESIIDNNTSSSEKVISYCLWHQNLFWTVFACKRCLICAYFLPDSEETTFSLENQYYGFILWTRILAGSDDLKLKTCSFWFHKTLTDGLEWCALLWCFYQLFGLSFWRHPFTTEDPLVSKWWLHFFKSEETNSFTTWKAWGWVHF